MRKLEANYLNPLENMVDITKQYGLYLALAVLAKEAIKFTTFIIMIIMTGLQEERPGVIVLMVSTIYT